MNFLSHKYTGCVGQYCILAPQMANRNLPHAML